MKEVDELLNDVCKNILIVKIKTNKLNRMIYSARNEDFWFPTKIFKKKKIF